MAGRPREFDRDLALECARDAFWLRGYEGVSMADLVSTMGIASARIYAAFGSKQELFREAVSLYKAGEGGFAVRAFEEEPTGERAIERMLRDAVETYTQRGKPSGCMMVMAATNCTKDNEAIRDWLAHHRRTLTGAIVDRLRRAVDSGELNSDTDVQALGDLFSALLRGLSVQARDGVSKKRLLALIPPAMRVFDASKSKPRSR